MNGRLENLTRSRDGKRWLVTFSTPEDFSGTFDELAEKEVSIEIKQARKLRSLDANAYCWKLIDMIAEKTGIRKTEVYRNAIREIGGVSAWVGIRDDLIPIFRASWESGHTGRQIEAFPSSTKPGWSNVQIYFGSSEFDSSQMSRLIDSLIQEAEQQGIPTITEKQTEKMIERWGAKNVTGKRRD